MRNDGNFKSGPILYFQEVQKLANSTGYKFRYDVLQPSNGNLKSAFMLSIKYLGKEDIGKKYVFFTKELLKKNKITCWIFSPTEIRVSADEFSQFIFAPEKKEISQPVLVQKVEKAKPLRMVVAKIPKLKKEKVKKEKVQKVLMPKEIKYPNRTPSLMHKKVLLLEPYNPEKYKDQNSLEVQTVKKAPINVLIKALFADSNSVKIFFAKYREIEVRICTNLKKFRYYGGFSKEEVQTVMNAPAELLIEVALSRPPSQIKKILGRYQRERLSYVQSKNASP